MTSSKAAEADEVIEALMSSYSTKEATKEDTSDEENEDKALEMEAYIKQLSFVHQDAQNFKEITVYVVSCGCFLLGHIICRIDSC